MVHKHWRYRKSYFLVPFLTSSVTVHINNSLPNPLLYLRFERKYFLDFSSSYIPYFQIHALSTSTLFLYPFIFMLSSLLSIRFTCSFVENFCWSQPRLCPDKTCWRISKGWRSRVKKEFWFSCSHWESKKCSPSPPRKRRESRRMKHNTNKKRRKCERKSSSVSFLKGSFSSEMNISLLFVTENSAFVLFTFFLFFFFCF